MALRPRPAICCSLPLVGPGAMREAVLAVRGPRSGASSSVGAGSEMRGGTVRLAELYPTRSHAAARARDLLCTFYVVAPGAGRPVVAGGLVGTGHAYVRTTPLNF